MDTKRNDFKNSKQDKRKLSNCYIDDGDVLQSIWV